MADLYSQADLGEMINDGQVLSFEAAAAITKGQAVKFVAVANDLPQVNVAGDGDKAIGVATLSVSAGEMCPVAMNGAIVKVTASGAITAGSAVKAAANGAVQAVDRVIDYVKGSATTYVPDDSTLEGVSLAANGSINVPASLAFGTALQTFANGDTGLILIGGAP